MLNTHFQLNEKSAANFRWRPDSQFRSMRTFIMSTHKMEWPFISHLVDAIDDLKNLAEGESKYIVCSDYNVWRGSTLEQLNGWLASYVAPRIDSGELSDSYTPHAYGFVIKRTSKFFTYKSIIATNAL